MTISMIITLAVVVLMVVVIISDKLPFGAPAILAAALLVVLNQTDIATAFSGFIDKNVILIMGFMACLAALQKTTAIYKLQGVLGKVASKGGLLGYALLLFAIMGIGNFISGTAYYVLVINIIATIPYSRKMPTSRILLPAALGSGMSGWLPNGAMMFISIAGSLLSAAGLDAGVISVSRYCLINIIWSAVFLVWAIIGQRLLPDRDISDTLAENSDENAPKAFVPTLKRWQEYVVYTGYVVLVAVMIFLQDLPGEIGYGVPVVLAGVFLACGIFSFKDMLGNMFSPVLIMMAGVIGVAAAMSNCGLSDFIGSKISGILGANPSLFVLVLVFSVLTSIMATFTGASFGSLFIFAPIGVALCASYGYSAIPLVIACTKAAWTNYIMPIDGLPALTMGVGKYKLTEFWKFTLPCWVMQMVLTAALCCALLA